MSSSATWPPPPPRTPANRRPVRGTSWTVLDAIGVAQEIAGGARATLSYLGSALVLTGQPEPGIRGGHRRRLRSWCWGGRGDDRRVLDGRGERMHERHLHTDPPTRPDSAAARTLRDAGITPPPVCSIGRHHAHRSRGHHHHAHHGEGLGWTPAAPSSSTAPTIEQAQSACSQYLRSPRSACNCTAGGGRRRHWWSEVMARVQRRWRRPGERADAHHHLGHDITGRHRALHRVTSRR